MALATKLMFLFLCVNVASMMMANVGIPLPTPSSTTTSFMGLNATALMIDAADSVSNFAKNANAFTFLYAFWAVIPAFLSIILGIFLGFPNLMLSLGVPWQIYTPIYLLWGTTFFLWIFHLATGRDVEI